MLNNNRNSEKKMKSLRNLLLLSLTIVGFLLAGTAAKADSLTLTLISPYQSGPESTYTFDATVTNTGDTTVYLNGDTMVLDAGLTLDDSPYNSNPAFFVLDPGDSYTGLLFTVTAPSYGTGSNFYTGTFSITGGGDDQAGDTLASANFDIQVTPEPPSFLLFGTGLLVLGSLAGRKLFV